MLIVGCGSPPAAHEGDDASIPPDAAVDPALDAGPDAPLDAAPDAPPDAPPDGGYHPGPAFHVAALALPIHRSVFESGTITLTATNDRTARITITAELTGPFTLDENLCTAIDPGQSCTIKVHCTAPAIGTYEGSVLLTAQRITVAVPLTVLDEAFVTASADAGGHVTVDPPEDGCPGCYPPGTVVTITATPEPGFHFVGWGGGVGAPSVCQTNPCTVMASATPTSNEASFALDPHTFALDFLGDGAGTVSVSTSSVPAICSASCTVVVDTPTFQVEAGTLVDFGGFGAPCGSGGRCTLPGTTASLDVTFSKRPGEQDIDVGGGVSVDFDPANELVVGGSTIQVLTQALAPKWTAPFAGVARFAANGDVLVRTTTTLLKLAAADGHVLWQHPTTGHSFEVWGPAHTLAATPAGGAVVDHGDSVELWSPDGSSSSTLAVDFPRTSSVATGADGRIYVGVASVDSPFDHTYIEVFSPLGVRQLPDVGSALPNGLNNAQGAAAIGVGTANLVVTNKSSVNDFVGFDQFAADRSYLGTTEFDYVPGSQSDLPPHVVATNASDLIAFAHSTGTMIWSFESGLDLTKYDAARNELWHVVRAPLGESSFFDADGFDLADIAIAPDGRIAALDKHSLVEVFAP